MKVVLLSSLPIGTKFITSLTKRPGIYWGLYARGGLSVEWEDELPTGSTLIHRSFKAIPR